MKDKWISSVVAGVFISMGAMVYLIIPDTIVRSLFFATGILLVLNLHNMLVTRVCPLKVYDGSYGWGDIAIAWIGNGIGTAIAALAVHFTRFEAGIRNSVESIGNVKLSDDPLSLFILGIFCALFVAFAVLIGAKQEKGSFAQIFYVWHFITAFVFCGFEHIVADMFYISSYVLMFGAEIMDIVKVLVFVSAGNLVGGLGCAWLIKRLDKQK